MRWGEFALADELRKRSSGQVENLPNLAISMLRDVVSFRHDRDFRFFNGFLIPAMKTLTASTLVVLEISTDNCTLAHVFAADGAVRNILFVVAHRGHVRWAMPTEYFTPKKWKNWTENIDEAIYHAMETASEYAIDHQCDGGVLGLPPCRLCGGIAKLNAE